MKNQENISKEQLDELLKKISDYNIPLNCIKYLLNIGYLQDMTVSQYNYLMLIIYQIETNY